MIEIIEHNVLLTVVLFLTLAEFICKVVPTKRNISIVKTLAEVLLVISDLISMLSGGNNNKDGSNHPPDSDIVDEEAMMKMVSILHPFKIVLLITVILLVGLSLTVSCQ